VKRGKINPHQELLDYFVNFAPGFLLERPSAKVVNHVFLVAMHKAGLTPAQAEDVFRNVPEVSLTEDLPEPWHSFFPNVMEGKVHS
jgi:hypothetical protein